MKPEASKERAAALHVRVREFLIATMPHESPGSIAAALMYEVSSIAASIAPTEPVAHELIDALAANAHAQIDAFGIGTPHP